MHRRVLQLRLILPTVALMSIVACVSVVRTSDALPGHVLARSTTDGIEVTNQTQRAVFYIAAEEGVGSAAALAPCSGRGCPAVDVGDQVIVPWSEVVENSAAKNDYLLYWWHDVRNSAGEVPRDSVHSLLVPR